MRSVPIWKHHILVLYCSILMAISLYSTRLIFSHENILYEEEEERVYEWTDGIILSNKYLFFPCSTYKCAQNEELAPIVFYANLAIIGISWTKNLPLRLHKIGYLVVIRQFFLTHFQRPQENLPDFSRIPQAKHKKKSKNLTAKPTLLPTICTWEF